MSDRAGKIHTRQKCYTKSIEVIKNKNKPSYTEIMLITHHQKTILESFFSVLMDIYWKNHTPSLFTHMDVVTHPIPTSVSWRARIMGVFCYKNVVTVKLKKLTGGGRWR